MNEYLAERAKWWPVSPELMAQYKDGSHSGKHPKGILLWLKNRLEHRAYDKPAVINTDGSLEWWKNGKCHRSGDKPAIIYANGTLGWFKNGERHRDDDKPAWITATNTLEWLKNGKLHRITGPAVIDPIHQPEYWINGVNINEEVESWLKSRKYKYPFTPEQQAEFQLTFG
jgi:hypothetical protein